MALFELIPASDLLGGRCVRLSQGRYDAATVYGDDPARIRFDEKPSPKPKQVLYTRKEGTDIEQITEPDILNAPWFPYTTAGGIKR